MLSREACFEALKARDGRFDGVFFVGVTTTGIYCRPICPARTPGASRCSFFSHAAEAERAGFRACFRCRPELAPGTAAVDSIPRLVRTAAARIESGWLADGRSIEDLAGSLGVSARHLRRAMEAELGVSPVELAQTRRLALAKQLLQDTAMPLADVAFASGFSSVRRFNDLFRARFGRAPSALRREHGAAPSEHDAVALRLDYRPPLDWAGLLSFLRSRAIPGVEAVSETSYRRSVRLGKRRGWLEVRPDPMQGRLQASVSLSLAPRLMEVAARLRALFDLDARPAVIGEHLSRDPLLAPMVQARPGLRVPGAFDGFETAVRAVLGQQVTVAGATTLSGRLVEAFGEELGGGLRLFPSASRLASAAVEEVQAIGMPASRAKALIGIAAAAASGAIDLTPGADPAETILALEALPGIGPWTAQYLAMRALRWPDAFPASDLALLQALDTKSPRASSARAEAWRPWRAYAAMHLWASRAPGQ